jgi:hypothetical protein
MFSVALFMLRQTLCCLAPLAISIFPSALSVPLAVILRPLQYQYQDGISVLVDKNKYCTTITFKLHFLRAD